MAYIVLIAAKKLLTHSLADAEAGAEFSAARIRCCAVTQSRCLTCSGTGRKPDQT